MFDFVLGNLRGEGDYLRDPFRFERANFVSSLTCKKEELQDAGEGGMLILPNRLDFFGS